MIDSARPTSQLVSVPLDALEEAVAVLQEHLDEWTGTREQRAALTVLRQIVDADNDRKDSQS